MFRKNTMKKIYDKIEALSSHISINLDGADIADISDVCRYFVDRGYKVESSINTDEGKCSLKAIKGE